MEQVGRSDTERRSYVPPPGQLGLDLMVLSLPNISASLGTSLSVLRFSNAQTSLAPSMVLRLLIQACFVALLRALTRLGMATAAKRPIMATTIMISTSVKA